MREILFRAKRLGGVDAGAWVEGSLIFYPRVNRAFFSTGDFNSRQFYEVQKDTVGQYTGMTDKNCKKIFEGDWVCYSDWDEVLSPEEATVFFAKVVFVNGCFGLAYDNIFLEMENWCNNDNFVSLWELEWNERLENIEVVGNIYDDPDLPERYYGERREGQ